MFSFQGVPREFQGLFCAVLTAPGLARRDDIGDVPDHENLARIGIEYGCRVNPAVRARDHHHAWRLAAGQGADFARPAAGAEALISFD